MSRVFAYARVSTVDQTTENQIEEIKAAGYQVEDQRFITEQISGSVPASQRKGFAKLKEKLEAGDTLIVTKLDRLGRDSIDVQQNIQWFKESGIRLIVLQLGNLDLTSSSGALIVGVLSSIAAFERELLIERTQAGLARARAQGKKLGRKPKLTDIQRVEIVQGAKDGLAISELARRYKVSRQTILNVRNAAENT